MEFFAKTFDELTTKELYEILKSRSQIFTIEQNIHCQDMDDIDYNSLHCYIMDDNKVVAYLRPFSQDDNKYIVRVGRVLTLVHGNGLGKELMQKYKEIPLQTPKRFARVFYRYIINSALN